MNSSIIFFPVREPVLKGFIRLLDNDSEINMSSTLFSFRPAAFIGYPFVPNIVNITEESSNLGF